MFVNRSPQASYRPTSKTLILDLNSTSSFHPNSTRLFPHRTKKVQQTDSLRKQKAVKLIEDIASYHLDKQR